MAFRGKVSLVTGGAKGVGHCIGKEIIQRIDPSFTFMCTRDSTVGCIPLLGQELGMHAAKAKARFITMDIRDKNSVKKNRDDLVKEFGGLDILVNNAGVYLKADKDHFPEQVKKIMETNYYGTKNVIKTFYHDFNEGARIVNITSNLAHVKAEINKELCERKAEARLRFKGVGSEEELDDLLKLFQDDVKEGLWEEKGWPMCAYSISKMAINTYTRILQKEFEDRRRNVIVSAVYPASHHKDIDKGDAAVIADEEAAAFVFTIATFPDSKDLPKGRVIWDEKKIMELYNDATLKGEITFGNKFVTWDE